MNDESQELTNLATGVKSNVLVQVAMYIFPGDVESDTTAGGSANASTVDIDQLAAQKNMLL